MDICKVSLHCALGDAYSSWRIVRSVFHTRYTGEDGVSRARVKCVYEGDRVSRTSGYTGDKEIYGLLDRHTACT